jgi:hypothetical protein
VFVKGMVDDQKALDVERPLTVPFFDGVEQLLSLHNDFSVTSS